MKMMYGVDGKPPFGKLLLFSLQQLMAILAATIAVHMIIGNGMSPSAALFGAGVGTLVYLRFSALWRLLLRAAFPCRSATWDF